MMIVWSVMSAIVLNMWLSWLEYVKAVDLSLVGRLLITFAVMVVVAQIVYDIE